MVLADNQSSVAIKNNPTEFGLTIKNPRKIFNGHFPLNAQPQYWG